MKKTLLYTSMLLMASGTLSAQKRVGELTLVYNYFVYTSPDVGKQISATATFYIKGNLSRAEVSSNLFSSATIYDSKAGSGVILKEVNGQKLLIRMNEDNWNQKNSKFASLGFKKMTETKMIAGYSCVKATASTTDGFDITVFYTRDVIPENKTYDPPFRNLDGLPLEYEISKGNLRIKYVLASINLNPVPASKFDIPTSGYRELTYEESRKLKLGN
jgi:GLPGLI family protein